MTVEACNKQKLMDDMDDDDGPLVFKRSSSSSSKQNQSNSDTKKSVPHKHDEQPGRPASNVRPQNGQNNSVQRSKIFPASKTPSPKLSNSLTKELEVKSTMVDSRPSTSMRGELTSVKRQIKGENSLNESTSGPKEESEDSEDDKPLSARLHAGRSKFNPGNANKGANVSNFGQTSKIPKSEDSDDEIPLSSKFRVKAVAGGSANRFSTSDKKPLLAECGQNGSASTDRKPSAVLKKRNVDSEKPTDTSIKRPKLCETSTPHKNKESSIKAEMEEEDEEDHIPISQRIKKTAVAEKKSAQVKKFTKPTTPITKFNQKPKKFIKNSKYSESSKVHPSSGDGQKWTTLVHNGVIFPPPYKPHGVKMLYKGKPVDLTSEQEEVLLSLSLSLFYSLTHLFGASMLMAPLPLYLLLVELIILFGIISKSSFLRLEGGNNVCGYAWY